MLTMEWTWEGIVSAFDGLAPDGSPKRKLLQILSIVLVIEGLSVLILFSYVGMVVGILSLALGALLLLILNPNRGRAPAKPAEVKPVEIQRGPREDPPGIKMIKWIRSHVGSDYIIMVAGAVIIAAVVVWNLRYSDRPGYGDMDTLTMIFGGLLIVFPVLIDKYETEASFSMIFIGLVVVFLVVPQVVTTLQEDAGSKMGNAYVHYMLAAPFAGILNLIGIDASSHLSVVVIQFKDGTHQALAISSYCAGLYSFTIFLAAFFSFVLVFERLPRRMLAFVLALGLIIAYLGNLFRMVIIGVVGYYRGLDALLWAHHNIGWIIFLSWSAVFWYILLGYISKPEASD